MEQDNGTRQWNKTMENKKPKPDKEKMNNHTK